MDLAIPLEYQERLNAIGVGFALTLITTSIGLGAGFYRLPFYEREGKPSLSALELLGAFFVFLFIQLLLVPTLVFVYLSIKAGHPIHSANFKLEDVTQHWLQIGSIIVTAIAVVGYTRILPQEHRRIIWGDGTYQGWKKNLKNIGIGSSAWGLSYPLIYTVGQLVTLILLWNFKAPHPDQVAVKTLKSTISDPILFCAMVGTIVFLVPLIEEVVFRGFLQTWLKQFLGRKWGIILTALIFATFHFAGSQGIANLELLVSLFILACFLGFVYERQKSLLASYSLHATFNTLSIIMILFQESLTT